MTGIDADTQDGGSGGSQGEQPPLASTTSEGGHRQGSHKQVCRCAQFVGSWGYSGVHVATSVPNAVESIVTAFICVSIVLSPHLLSLGNSDRRAHFYRVEGVGFDKYVCLLFGW